MAIFQNSFFSAAGQKERLSNVVNTLKSAVTGKGVQANTSSPVLNKVLSTAASHPFATAGVAAVAVNPTGALAAGKAVTNKLVTSFTGAKLTTQAAVVGGGLIGGSALISSPKLQKAAVNTPSALTNFGGNLGELIENPNTANAKALITENPVVSAALGTGIAVLGGVGVGAIANTVSNMSNTSAIKANTKAMAASIPAVAANSSLLVPEELKKVTSSNIAPPTDSTKTTSSEVISPTSTAANKPSASSEGEKKVSQSQRVNVYTAPVQYKRSDNRKVYIEHKHRGKSCRY